MHEEHSRRRAGIDGAFDTVVFNIDLGVNTGCAFRALNTTCVVICALPIQLYSQNLTITIEGLAGRGL
jgi:hypothetical protein